jgi:hypothetical protein
MTLWQDIRFACAIVATKDEPAIFSEQADGARQYD